MRKVFLLLVMIPFIAGCSDFGGFGDSQYNPVNWFDGDEEAEELAYIEPVVTEDPRQLVLEVTSLGFEPTSDGMMVIATGLPATQGFWDAELVPTNNGLPLDGILTYRFVAAPPPDSNLTEDGVTTEINAIKLVLDQNLRGVTHVKVLAETNVRILEV